MSGLPRAELLALIAAAHARSPLADAAERDPFLQKRLDDAAAIARWEEKLRRAAVTAFGRWTGLVRSAVLDGHHAVLAAAGEDEPAVSTRIALTPDANAVAGLGPAWDQIAQATIVTSVGDLLGEVFGAYALDGAGVISARAWQSEHLATVSNRLSGIPDQTFDRVRVALQDGYDKGESIPHLRDRVAGVLSTRQGGEANFWRNRATTIARTETTGAMNGGHVAAWRAMSKAVADAGGEDDTTGGGDPTAAGTKIWVATMDERTRPSHVAADGQSRPVNKPFDLMGGPMDYPGDPSGPASETVNCRCTVMYVADGDPIPTVPGGRQLGQDTDGFRDGVAETSAAEDAAAADEAAAVDEELAADDAGLGPAGDDVQDAADADAEDALTPATVDGEPAPEFPLPESEPTTEPTEPTAEPAEAEPAPGPPTQPEPTPGQAGEQAATDPAAYPDGVDEAGAPWRLSYDYLSSLDDEQLDDLTSRLADGLGDGDPLAGARFDDLERYLDVTGQAEELVSMYGGQGLADDRITTEINRFLAENGTPGLTHPDVGGAPVAATVTRAQVQEEYATLLEEQYLRAEQYTRGHLLSPTGKAKGANPRLFFGGGWKGGIRDLLRDASQELLEFWETVEPRVSWAEYYYQRTGSEAWAEKAAKAARANAGIARDRINPLTAAPSASRLASANTARPAAVTAAGASTPSEPTDAQRGAYAGGRAAFDAGEPSTALPHDLWADDPAALGLLWVRGYVQARTAALLAAEQAAGLLDATGRIPGPRQLTAAPRTTGPSAGQDDPAGASHPTPSEGSTMPPRTWRSDPFLAPFATPTGDGRIFAVGSLTNRDLPLPLLFQDSSAPGHDQSVVVGRILSVSFTDAGIVAEGDYLDDPALGDTVAKAVALVEAGLGHVSVDLAACTGELVDESGQPVDMAAIFDAWDRGEDPVVLEQVTAGELIACTQVATPAFGVGAKIAMSDGASVPEADGVPAAPATAPATEPGQTSALDGGQAFVMVDKAGDPIAIGDVVEVATDAAQGDEGTPAADAPAEDAPPADGDGTEEDTGQTVRGTITAVDPKANKVTVQPEGDVNAEPLVVSPDAIVKVDAPSKKSGEDGVPTPAGTGGASITRTPGDSGDAAETFAAADPADPAGDPQAPDAAGEQEPEPVQAVTDAGDLALLTAVAPHYDAAAQAARDAFAQIKDERVKALAADLVEDAAEWSALLTYGLTPDDDDEDGLLAAALVAAAGPMTPPADWFANPQLSGPTPLTITEDGRVFGHVAVWGTCHVGFSNTCVTPPPSPSSYAYFHTGEVVTADGSRVAVGNLTLGGRHADVKLAYRSAIEHYDVRGAGVATVRMYEDEHGIAFSGALSPNITEEQLYDLRRSPVSGDWRRVGGNLELIGVLSVNAPGFPTPRFATDVSGRTALTAAPSVRPSVGPRRISTRVGRGLPKSAVTAHIEATIRSEVVAELGRQRSAEARAKRLAVATIAIKGEPRARLAALAASVDGGRSQARRDRLAELAEAVA